MGVNKDLDKGADKAGFRTFFLIKKGDDNYQMVINNHFYELKDCKNVSQGYIIHLCKDFINEEIELRFYNVADRAYIISVDSCLDSDIKNGRWDWRKQVESYSGHNDMNLSLLNKKLGEYYKDSMYTIDAREADKKFWIDLEELHGDVF